MKLTINKQEFNHAIQQASRAVSSRPTIPILSGIKLSVNYQGMTLTASDTDISIESFIPTERGDQTLLQVERPGSVILGAKFLTDIVKKLPTDTISLEVNNGFQTTIISGTSEIQMIGIDPEEFPVLPAINQDKVLEMSGSLFKTLIQQTIIATATNEQIPILTGILWRLKNGILHFTATDRHRLAERKLKISVDDQMEIQDVVISAKTLNELSKLIPDDHTPVAIFVANNQVLFNLGNLLLYSRILDGNFPDISKVIPQVFKTELIVSTELIRDAVDRAYIMSREEKTNIVRLTTLEGQTIEVSSSLPEIGKVTEIIEPISLTGDPLKIAFNSKFMLDALRVIEAEQLFIGFSGPTSPIIIRPADDETDTNSSTYLILPYRTVN